MENFKWDRELIEKLIALWQQYDHLYDPNDKNFRNTKMRIDSYHTIFKELKKNVPDEKFTREEMKRKLGRLRNEYNRESYLHQQSCTESGLTLDDFYEPKLWYYEKLHFLRPYSQHVQKEIEKIQDHPLMDKYNQTEPRPKKRRIAFATRDLQQQIDSVTNLIKNRVAKKYDWLGKQVSVELSNIQDASLQEETSCAIQLLIRENVTEDKIEQQPADIVSCGSSSSNICTPPKQFKTEIEELSQDSVHFNDDDTATTEQILEQQNFKGKLTSNDESNFYETDEDQNPLSPSNTNPIDDIFLEEDDIFVPKLNYSKKAVKKKLPPSESKKLIALHEEKTKAEIMYFKRKSTYFQKQTDNLEIQRKLMILQAQKVRIEIEKLRNDI